MFENISNAIEKLLNCSHMEVMMEWMWCDTDAVLDAAVDSDTRWTTLATHHHDLI